MKVRRKMQKIGGSYYLNLPMKWITDRNISENSELELVVLQDGGLKVAPEIQEIPAEEVIIKCKDKSIIISQPEVMLADMMGKDVYQITGVVSESTRPTEHDIKMVMRKTGKGREEVVKALEDLNNDLAAAIVELKQKKGK